METQDLNKLVVIRSGLTGQQANMLKVNLEGHGVPAFLANENMSGLLSVSNADLYVRARDWRAAEQLLGNIETLPQRYTTVPDAGPDLEFADEPACRHCGSTRVHPHTGDVPTWIPFMRQQALPVDRWMHCMECDSYYRGRRPRFAGLPIALGWSLFMGVLALTVVMLLNWLKYL